MTRNRAIMATLIALGLSALSACAKPHHLGEDFGRAYSETLAMQKDLTRASAQGLDHPLAGVEAQAIRLNVQTEATNEETGESNFQIGDGN